MMTGSAASRRDRRRFVLTQPVLDYGSLEPGGKANTATQAVNIALAPYADLAVSGVTAPTPQYSACWRS